MQASDGYFYGTTIQGGSGNLGTIFKVNANGAFTSLYSFCSKRPNCLDGALPEGTLIQARDGNIYGTTAVGGVGVSDCSGIPPGCGTIFRLNLSGKFTTVYRFHGADGAEPLAGLVESSEGTFYGTTYDGGQTNVNCSLGCGTVFQITPQSKLATLYKFCTQLNCADGSGPHAAMVQGSDGNLYSTTFAGGLTSCEYGCGTIFWVNPSGAFSTLYRFCSQTNCADGYNPQASVVQATNGVFYGTTSQGNLDGTIFSLDTSLNPFITFVRAEGKVGQTGGILGQGFTGTTSVVLNGVPATFTVVSDTFIRATVPAGATTGYVTVTTPTGTLTSNVPFYVLP